MARRPVESKDEEQPPEADRLEGFPHPRETQALFGHAAAEADLRQAADSGRLHHGWLLAGPDGVGKATLAYRLARYLLAAPAERAQSPAGRLAPPQESTAFRQVLARSHPGLLVVRRAFDGKRVSSQIRVDEVRRLKSFLGLTAGAGQWRVVIVDPADDMNQNAANALLKSLEEPPARTVFLLISSEPGRLLPTIRSRCRTLELGPLAADDLWQAAVQALAAAAEPGRPPPEQDRAVLAALAQGSVRHLLTLSASGGLAVYERLLALLESLPRLDELALHALADEIGAAAAEQKFETACSLLLDLLARLVRASISGQAESARELALARRLVPRPELASWAELWERIVRDKAVTMALNLDRRSFVLQTGFRMRALAMRAAA
jgi:DNA polymerase-3 subunit delta'